MAQRHAREGREGDAPTFQDVIVNLQRYWASTGCVVLQPHDNEVGAGTNAPATTLRSLGPDTWRTCYVQGCRRPPTAATARTPTAGSSTTSSRCSSSPRRTTSRTCTWEVLRPSASMWRPTTCASWKTTGRADAGRLGPGLGDLDRRHGSDPVHLLPAGGRLRVQPGASGDRLRA